MNKLQTGLKHLAKTLNDNSPAILTSLGVTGTITTAYLTGKASFKAARVLDNYPESLKFKDKAKIVYDLYIPPVLTGVFTIGCIIGANRINSKRAAAAYSILTISEKAFEEYREKVVERLGEKKDQEIKDEIAQDRVNANPPSKETILITGQGDVLCCELFTGRYFNSDMETLRKAQNDINAQIVSSMYVCLNDFYYIVGLPYTSQSGSFGWTSERLMSLDFTTVLTNDNKPCLAFEYNYIDVI